MSDLLPRLIVLALGGAIAPPLLLLTILFWDSRLEFSILGFSKASLPNATALGLGYFAVLRSDGYLGANPLRRGGGQSEGTGGREEVTQERER
jgi:hypothetical protein